MGSESLTSYKNIICLNLKKSIQILQNQLK